MTFLFLSTEGAKRLSRERVKIRELNAFHDKFNTVPFNEGKIVYLCSELRLSCDNFLRLQEKTPQPSTIQEKVSSEAALKR